MAGERTEGLGFPHPHNAKQATELAAAVALAVAAPVLAFKMWSGADQGPKVAPQTPNTPTEPQKAPEQNSNTPNVVTSPGFPGFENTTSAPPKPPEVNLVDQAIKAGVIKAEIPQDFAAFFAAMTKEDFTAAIAKAQETGQVKVVDPIKKNGPGRLELKDFKSKGLTNNPAEAPEKTFLGGTGIEAGDQIVSSITGIATIYHAAIPELGIHKMIFVKNGFTEVVIMYKDPQAESSFPNKIPVAVTVGDSLYKAVAPSVFPETGPFAGYGLVMWVKKDTSWDVTSIADLVQAGDKRIATAG